MPLLARTIATPVAVEIRRGAIAQLAPLLADGRISAGGKVAIAVGPGQGDAIAEQVRAALPAASLLLVESGTLEGAQELVAALREGWYDAVVGIGGGKTLDGAKYAASMIGLPFVAVATTLTNDGLASPVASLETQGRKASFGVHIPIAVFVDIDFVAGAPRRHTISGLGDVVSNLSAIADWELAAAVHGEAVDGLAASFSRSAAEAVLRAETELTGERFLVTLAESLVLSGVAMSISGTSRPCSGACHEISHALDAMYGGPGLHGEQVAVGALFACHLRDDGLADEIDACLRRFEVPRLPADLGLSAEQFSAAVVEAPSTRPGRFTVLEHLDLDPGQVRERVDAFIETYDR